MDALDVIEPGIPTKDNCPVMTRIQSFVNYEGMQPDLQFTFRDDKGNPVDLSPPATSESASESESESETAATTDRVLIRYKELTGEIDRGNNVRLLERTGSVVDASSGVVRAPMPEEIAKRSGIYQVSWGFERGGRMLLVRNSLLSQERSLFGFDDPDSEIDNGPPTIQDIRMQLMDSDPAENVLLDEVEFSDDQIVLAISQPVEDFNEVPPPLSVTFTTLDFPWKSHWLDAAIGYLLQWAAHNYRRNRLAVNAGGMTVDDKNKEREYLRMSQQMLQEWKSFMQQKKVELNAQEFVGTIGSTYGSVAYGRNGPYNR